MAGCCPAHTLISFSSALLAEVIGFRGAPKNAGHHRNLEGSLVYRHYNSGCWRKVLVANLDRLVLILWLHRRVHWWESREESSSSSSIIAGFLQSVAPLQPSLHLLDLVHMFRMNQQHPINISWNRMVESFELDLGASRSAIVSMPLTTRLLDRAHVLCRLPDLAWFKREVAFGIVKRVWKDRVRENAPSLIIPGIVMMR